MMTLEAFAMILFTAIAVSIAQQAVVKLWRKEKPREIARSGTAFITRDELDEHCGRLQAGCPTKSVLEAVRGELASFKGDIRQDINQLRQTIIDALRGGS